MIILEFLTKKTSNNELVDYSLKAASIKEALQFIRGWKSPDERLLGKPVLVVMEKVA